MSGGGGGGTNNFCTLGATTCQYCGNQAKKDCSRRRCRTCCKSRGLGCATQVKSTWVPAARRCVLQLSTAATAGSTSGVKKPRIITSQATTSHTSPSNTTSPTSFDTSSSHQGASFQAALPVQVYAQAVFKCVRVRLPGNHEDRWAYI